MPHCFPTYLPAFVYVHLHWCYLWLFAFFSRVISVAILFVFSCSILRSSPGIRSTQSKSSARQKFSRNGWNHVMPADELIEESRTVHHIRYQWGLGLVRVRFSKSERFHFWRESIWPHIPFNIINLGRRSNHSFAVTIRNLMTWYVQSKA